MFCCQQFKAKTNSFQNIIPNPSNPYFIIEMFSDKKRYPSHSAPPLVQPAMKKMQSRKKKKKMCEKSSQSGGAAVTLAES